MPKNAQTNAQLHASHMLAKKCSKFPKLGFNSMWTVNFQIFKLDLEKGEEPEQIAKICWIMEKARKFQKKIFFRFIDYNEAFECVDHNKLEYSEGDGNTRPHDLPPEKSVGRSRSSS